MYVSALLVSLKLLKTKRWYVEHKCKSTISRFLIGQNVKKWLCCDVCDCSPRRLVGGNRSCKGPVAFWQLGLVVALVGIDYAVDHPRESNMTE